VHAISIELDLVEPTGAVRCLLYEHRELRLDPSGQVRASGRPMYYPSDFATNPREKRCHLYGCNRPRRIDVPRASWRGYLRLSLVSGPIYLSPATVRTKPIRLHQVWRATPPGEAGDVSDQERGQDVPSDRRRGLLRMMSRISRNELARQRGSRPGLTIRAPARKSRKRMSSGDTSMNAANT
jgi:hypothetical protein